MKLRDRRVGLLVLTVLVFVSQTAQTPLRPLVMRANEQRGVPPTECSEGLANAPTPRIDVAEIPLPEPAPADVPPPPSSALRGELEAVQNALVRNNRPAFDENLARVRELVSSYPPGGERTAAENVLRVYADAARLWDAQYTSPFFGQGSPEYTAVSAYPGYEEAVRRATFTDARGNRFYPAAESREFLAGIAAQRLQRLGVRAATPAPRVTRNESSTPLPDVTTSQPRRTTETATRTTPRNTTTRSTTRRSTTSTSRTSASTSRSSTSTSRSSTSTSRPTRSAASSTVTRKPAAATPAPSTPNPSAPPTTAAVPAPAATAGSSPPAAGGSSATAANDIPPANVDAPTATTTTTDLPTATSLDTDTAASSSADTAFSPTPMTDTTSSTAPLTTGGPDAPATQKRPVFLATILILIGLGVLIVLFRASR